MKPDESWMVARPLKINNDSSKATSAPRSVTAKGLVPETDDESSEVKAHTTIWLAGQGARTASPAGLNVRPAGRTGQPGGLTCLVGLCCRLSSGRWGFEFQASPRAQGETAETTFVVDVPTCDLETSQALLTHPPSATWRGPTVPLQAAHRGRSIEINYVRSHMFDPGSAAALHRAAHSEDIVVERLSSGLLALRLHLSECKWAFRTSGSSSTSRTRLAS
jgi:hypothetical protein